MGGYSGKVYNTPEEAEEFVKTTVDAHPVVLFTKRFSPYCYKATSSFKSINVKYEEVLLSGRPDCQIIQDVLLKMTGARTVPRVFVHQKCIGGGNETKAFYSEGKLKEMVENKGDDKEASAEQQVETKKDESPAEEQSKETNSEQPEQQAEAEKQETGDEVQKQEPNADEQNEAKVSDQEAEN